MLRNFYWEGQRLKITAMPWLCQVRAMELRTQLTVSETLEVLASTMNLTSLQLDYYIAADGSAFAHSLSHFTPEARAFGIKSFP